MTSVWHPEEKRSCRIKPAGFLRRQLNYVLFSRLVLGIDYTVNGPIHQAIERYGELTMLDYVSLRICCLLSLPNERLENKMRAIGYAFLKEARLLEATSVGP